jgi:hypothetical protein
LKESTNAFYKEASRSRLIVPSFLNPFIPRGGKAKGRF